MSHTIWYTNDNSNVFSSSGTGDDASLPGNQLQALQVEFEQFTQLRLNECLQQLAENVQGCQATLNEIQEIDDIITAFHCRAQKLRETVAKSAGGVDALHANDSTYAELADVLIQRIEALRGFTMEVGMQGTMGAVDLRGQYREDKLEVLPGRWCTRCVIHLIVPFTQR